MITSWRIAMVEYSENAFDGEGAYLYGGRWNSRGVRLVYTSSSAALAALEMLVRIRRRESLRRYVLFACSFDEALVQRLDRKSLPADWRTSPPPAKLQDLGDTWIRGAASCVLEVPSAVIESESNFLLNPEHPDFPKVHVAEPVPFSLDMRLVSS